MPEYLALSFPEPPLDRPYVILNMVTSADGKAASGGTEAPLSSPTDKLAMQSLRVHADAVLDGAGTAQASGVNPSIRNARLRERRISLGRSEAPIQAVLSGSASVPPDSRFLRRTEFRLVVFVSESAPEDRIARLRLSGCQIEVLPTGERLLPELLRRLRESYGVRLLLLEGGPTLNSSFFHRGLIDEMFLTIGPHIVDGRDTPTAVEGMPFGAESMPALQLLSAYTNEGTSEVYLHWRIRH